jgi:hypothetical protein
LVRRHVSSQALIPSQPCEQVFAGSVRASSGMNASRDSRNIARRTNPRNTTYSSQNKSTFHSHRTSLYRLAAQRTYVAVTRYVFDLTEWIRLGIVLSVFFYCPSTSFHVCHRLRHFFLLSLGSFHDCSLVPLSTQIHNGNCCSFLNCR